MYTLQRKELMLRLGRYLSESDPAWERSKERAYGENNWFIPAFVDRAAAAIAAGYLSPEALDELFARYGTEAPPAPKDVGLVLAGNIPMVGFHDILLTFLSGHNARIKPSSKDGVLIKHLVEKLHEWAPETEALLRIEERISGCDAYIATGSDNSARYFEYYFGKYPSVIRRNRTSVAVLTGGETREELEALADDVYLYFGLGCRNVTQIHVPEGYRFEALLDAFAKWNELTHHNKYKNNYDYQLAVQLLNHKYYMTNGSLLLVENEAPVSPISTLHYRFYTDLPARLAELSGRNDLQCIVGAGGISFGGAQVPSICTWADGVDTMAFLRGL